MIIYRYQQGAGSCPGQWAGNADTGIADIRCQNGCGADAHDKLNDAGGKGSSCILHALNGRAVDRQKTKQQIKRSHAEKITVGIPDDFLCGIREEQKNDKAAEYQNADAHQNIQQFRLNQTGIYALADTFLFSGSIILSHVTGNGGHHGVVYQNGYLVGFCGCRISGDSGGTKPVDRSLHGKLSDTHDRHLEAHGKAELQMLHYSASELTEICFSQPDHVIRTESDSQAAKSGKKLGQYSRPGRAGDTHLEGHNKHDIQHNVQQGREHEKVKRRSAVPKGSQNIGNHVIKNRSAGAEQDNKHILPGLAVNILGYLNPVQNRMGEAAAESGDDHCKKDGEKGRGCDALSHALFILGPVLLAQTDAETVCKALNKAQNKIDNHTAGAHGGQSRGAQSASDNDGVGKCVKELKQISAYDGERKFQQDPKRIPFRKIPGKRLRLPLI